LTRHVTAADVTIRLMEAGDEPLWPRNKAELRARFEKDGFDPEEIPDGDQARLLLVFVEIYANDDKNLAPATRPLCECCPKTRAVLGEDR